MKLTTKKFILLGFLVILATTLILYLMGRVPICKCGYVKIWHGITQSSGSSQHLFDWYTLTHIVHGFLFYATFWLFLRNASLKAKALVALSIESLWEIVENTETIIHRYREATISLDYYGDSIINSIGDIFAMLFGFFIAANVSVAVSIFIILFLEVFLWFAIKDNLSTNILMLVYPSGTVRELQKR